MPSVSYRHLLSLLVPVVNLRKKTDIETTQTPQRPGAFEFGERLSEQNARRSSICCVVWLVDIRNAVRAQELHHVYRPEARPADLDGAELVLPFQQPYVLRPWPRAERLAAGQWAAGLYAPSVE